MSVAGEILFLCHRPPWPPTRGDAIRSWAVLNHLAERAPTHVVCFGDPQDRGLHEALSGVAASHTVVRRSPWPVGAMAAALSREEPLSVAAFHSSVFARAVADVVDSAGVTRTYVFSGQMAQYASDGAILDLVDVDSAKFAAYAAAAPDPARRWLYAREARTLGRFEHAAAARAAHVLFVSEAEAALWRSGGGGGDVRVVGNGIDLDRFDPAVERARPVGLPQKPTVLFTGQMDYAPNIEAAVRFAREVLPRIGGGATFVIAGRAPTAAVRALAAPDVLVTGEVADMRDWIAHADVVVAPLVTARGVQNKVLEALAMGRPVVASTPAWTGLELEPGRDLVVADTPDQQAEAVRALLADRDRRAALGSAGRAAVAERYRWAAQLAPLDALIDSRDRVTA